MTPLAHKIVRELTLPIKDRKFYLNDPHTLQRKMSDIHCFECSAVIAVAVDLALKTVRSKMEEEKTALAGAPPHAKLSQVQWLDRDALTAFLPAPKTWIEYDAEIAGYHILSRDEPQPNENSRGREGFLLEQLGDQQIVRCTNAAWRTHDNGHVEFSSQLSWMFPLSGHPDFGKMAFTKIACPRSWGAYDEAAKQQKDSLFNLANGFTVHSTLMIITLLALINSPRVIGRKQHMPHAGLARALLREQKVIGKFPLLAWTEILLECRPPKHMEDTPGYEAHLTGRRCLHFCRAHLRLRYGEVEFVKAHWRGDASLGIKQSRYRLTQPKDSAA